ncbi:MAG: GNAT family N-acetyltransferase [Deltaproteobacteria bacterium]|nr:GNAT family N-acetyltransferase [Deltaproteobacteria bacterium]
MAVIRTYQPGDEGGILRLFATVFQSEVSLEAWRWKYLREGNPPPVVVAEENSEIVCHMAALRQRVLWQGQEVIAWDSVDTMCHPRFQGRGLFKRTIQAFMREWGTGRSAFLYGFPTERHKRLGELLVGYEPVARVYRLHHEVAPAATIPAAIVTDVLPPHWDEHWRKLARRFAMIPQRDHAHLRWRYLARPDRHYRFVTIPMAPALAVVALQPGKAALMEFLVDHEDPTLSHLLLAGVEGVAREAGVPLIEAWFPRFSWEQEFLCAASGYSGGESEHWLECRLFDQRLSASWLAEHFFYSLGDFDVY